VAMTEPSDTDTIHPTRIDPGPQDPGALRFEDLIFPMTRAEFFTSYWEQKPLVARGRSQNFFRSLFSSRDVDDVILYQRPKPGSIDLVTDQGFVRDNFLYADGTANINLVYQSYLKGSTVILSGLESSWPPLATFCRNLEGDLNHPVGVAVYMTPPHTLGVKPHFDTQEGFLVQIDGSKRWKVYKPVHEFPPVEGSYTSVEREKLSEPIFETVLSAGDVLYIPRGFPHEGMSGDGQASLHITLEIHVRSWFDLMSDALGALADRDMRFRRSVPVGFLNDAGAMNALLEQFDRFKRIFHDGSSLEDAVHKHVEHLVVKKPPLPDGHFAVLFEKIQLDTPLKKRRIALSRLFDEGGMAGLQFSGNRIVGPAKIKPALEFIQSVPAFAAADLPGGLSEKEKLVLVNRLITIGLLTIA
jgi:bifunctional lysine-specific demethylase and histidyl-hydroxylase NO66